MRYVLVLLALTLCSCKLGPFDDLEKEASLVAFDPPSGIQEFGGVLATFTGRSATGVEISRIVGSRGIGFGQVTFSAWDSADDDLGPSRAVTERCNQIGADMPDCPEGASAAFAGIAVWRDRDGTDRRDCYVTSNVRPVLGSDEPVIGEGSLLVMCEASRETMRILPVEGVDLGTDLASLPEAHPAGVALISATRGPEGGQLYRLENAGAMPLAIPNPTGVTLSSSARLGSPLETHEVASFTGLDQPVIVAAGAPGDGRVVLMALGLNAGVVELQTLGCVDGVTTRAPRDTEGGELALGNVDGDAELELIIGDAENDRLLVVDVPTSPGTCDTPLATTEIPCPGAATGTPDASCAAASFGWALAAADVDADGSDDVIIGAPTADVGGDEDSGAIYVIPGSSSGLDSAAARVLVPSSVGPGDQLGRAVAAAVTRVESSPRFEPVASAPGENAVFLFLCTGLPGDTAVEGDLCLP